MPRPRAFITGIGGFAGSWLAEELLAHGWDVHGALAPKEPTRNIAHLKSDLSLVRLDILNEARTHRAIAAANPRYLFHLAALAAVGKSFSAERETMRVNVEGTLNVLTAARHLRSIRKIVVVSSSDCYGRFSPKNKTLTETDPLNPISPYGISKAAAEGMGRHYHRRYGLPVVIARSFNHCGPRQAENFVVPDFARQVARIMLGRQKPVLKVGNLDARRDLSDVRDIVRGYRLAATRGRSGRTYNLCSGRAVRIGTILRSLVSLSGKGIDIVADKARLRPADIPIIRGDNRRAVQELGYQSRYTIQETLRRTLRFWLKEYDQKRA